jgi:tetratricopeptide (TPR) repeat protein
MSDDPIPFVSPTPTAPTVSATENAAAQKFENLRSYITGGIIGFFLVFIVWGGITLAAELSQKKLQREYLSLTDDASRANFAKRNINNPLGGLVLLGQANEYYSQGNYAAAKAAYSQAIGSGLKIQPVLLEQAILGEAFSTCALDAAKGLESLAAIAKNPDLMQSTRAYAACELAGYYAGKNDFKQARDYLQLMKTLKDARAWQRQVAVFGEMYPELKDKDNVKLQSSKQ